MGRYFRDAGITGREPALSERAGSSCQVRLRCTRYSDEPCRAGRRDGTSHRLLVSAITATCESSAASSTRRTRPRTNRHGSGPTTRTSAATLAPGRRRDLRSRSRTAFPLMSSAIACSLAEPPAVRLMTSDVNGPDIRRSQRRSNAACTLAVACPTELNITGPLAGLHEARASFVLGFLRDLWSAGAGHRSRDHWDGRPASRSRSGEGWTGIASTVVRRRRPLRRSPPGQSGRPTARGAPFRSSAPVDRRRP